MPVPEDLESTAGLLERVRGGDAGARERLLSRYVPALRRWAHGRLPPRARELADTDDLVQVTLIRALDHLGDFEPRRPGAFLAW
jgi:RNA polymerase sigma-70 factor (ECF subfamily)